MSNELRQTFIDYISQTRVSILSTVREDGAPTTRAIGGFAPVGLDVYFSTSRQSDKAAQIARHPVVSFYFQHDGQQVPNYKYVTLIGSALEQAEEQDRAKAIEILSARSPRFKARAEKGELAGTVIYKVQAKELKLVDLSKGVGADSTQILKF